MGVAPQSEYKPYLDVKAVSVGLGGLSLHDGEVPLRRAGLGTRRLLAMAMQREAAKAGGLILDYLSPAEYERSVRDLALAA